MLTNNEKNRINTPLRDGSGQGTRNNYNRGGCNLNYIPINGPASADTNASTLPNVNTNTLPDVILPDANLPSQTLDVDATKENKIITWVKENPIKTTVATFGIFGIILYISKKSKKKNK